jgi:pimeloyl-ACP methyl ester carboxylesterase
MGSQASFDLQAPGVEESSAMDWFAARGFDAWCFDCRGYGRSDKPAGVLATVADGAEDLAAASRYIMEARGTGPLLVYGTSSGALRAALFAERHPERVRRLALDALVWTGKDSPTLAQRRKRLPELLKSPRRPLDRAALASIFTRDRPGTARDDIVEPFIAAVLALEDSVPNGTYIDMCSNLPLVDPARITMPTLVLRGQYDGIASVDDVYEFFRRLPNPEKEFCMVPGVAHSSLKQKNYQRTLHALHSFFTRPAPVYREG